MRRSKCASSKKTSKLGETVFFISPQTSTAYSEIGFVYDEFVSGNVQYLMNEATSKKDKSDLKFTYGLQGGLRVGLTRLLGIKFDLDGGSKELSLSGRKYANENYSIRADVLGVSLGLDASRSMEISPALDKLSVSYLLSGRDFDFKPAIEMHSISSKEFWTFDFGVSLGLGIEGVLDFSPYIKSAK